MVEHHFFWVRGEGESQNLREVETDSCTMLERSGGVKLMLSDSKV